LKPWKSVRSLTALTAITAIGLSLLPAGGVSPAIAAPIPSVTTTSKALVDDLPTVEPIFVGYKGPTSFIPAAVANKKDSKGCNLRQRMIIDLASKKPKVGKGCKMKGGVWETALGSKVTKPASLIIQPVMSYKDAWGQGAFAWTPAQRLAWATNTSVSGSKTRAKGVTNLQVTQFLISKPENRKTQELADWIESQQKAKDDALEDASYFIKRECLPWSIPCALQWALIASTSAGIAELSRNISARLLSDERCSLLIQLASNTTAWGLSVNPQNLELMQEVNKDCASTEVRVALESAINGINRITPNTVVEGGNAGSDPAAQTGSGGVTVVSDYPDPGSGVAVPSGSFGIHAPVDWGTPAVGASWIRLWDAGVSWAQMEPTQGNIDFSKLEASITAAKSQGSSVLYVLGNTPGWANGGKPGNVAPTNNATAIGFISRLVQEFGDRIAAYEVWNEGNLDTYWVGSQVKLADLTKGIKDTVGATSQVFAASTATRATNAFVTNYGAYLEELRERNWPVDAYTVHSYPIASGGPDQRVAELAQFKTLLALSGAPVKPIYDTELNYGLAGLGEDRRAIDDSTGAAYIAQSYIQSIQYGVESTFWYLWTGTSGNFDLLGVQLDPSTPVSNAVWNNLRGMLVGQRMTRCVDSGDVRACQFASGSGEQSTMLWTSVGTAQVNVTGLGSQVCSLVDKACTSVGNAPVTVGMLPVRIS
jgi:hypothetical protein